MKLVLAIGLLVSSSLVALSGCATTGASSDALESSDPETTFDATGERVPTARTLLTMAHILAKRGNDPQCEVVLRKLIESHPDCAQAYNELAEACMRQDRPEDAVAAIERGLEFRPRDPVLWNNLGMIHLLREDYPSAIDTFTRACAVSPLDSRPRANLASAMAMQGRMEEAEALYLQAVSRSDAYHNMSVLCTARGDHERADWYHELASGRRPKGPPPPVH